MTNAELKTGLRDDLSIATGDAFYSDAYIQRVINRAVKWLAALHNWQQTQEAYTRNSVANQEYYNYPENFKTDSIWKIRFNGNTYTRTTFSEYQKYQEDGNATDYLFSDHKRKYFLNPAPTTIASMDIYGHVIPDTMSGDSDTHPFSGEADLEEAIVTYAQGLCLKKGRGTNYERGAALIAEARAIADRVWDLQKREQSKYQTKDITMFSFQPILPQNGAERRSERGNFTSLS